MTNATFEDHPTDPDKVILRKKPYLGKGRDYEEGFVDGMQHQMQSSVDKAVNRMAQPEQEPVMILPDGSAFGVMSFPLPDDHWLYAPNEYKDGEYEPIDLPKPILTHALRDAVVAAVRYAVRGATMRGQETDFDPDALVQNAVYALCGPYTTPPQSTWVGLTDEEYFGLQMKIKTPMIAVQDYIDAMRMVEAKLKDKNGYAEEKNT